MKYRIFAGFVVVEAMVLGILFITASLSAERMEPELRVKERLVQGLMLTDLALWSEARYTRHPSQADFFTPFQDFPGAIDHFPAGSILAPPSMASFAKIPNDRATSPGE